MSFGFHNEKRDSVGEVGGGGCVSTGAGVSMMMCAHVCCWLGCGGCVPTGAGVSALNKDHPDTVNNDHVLHDTVNDHVLHDTVNNDHVLHDTVNNDHVFHDTVNSQAGIHLPPLNPHPPTIHQSSTNR